MNDSLKFSMLVGIGASTFLVFFGLSLRDTHIAPFVETAGMYEETYASYETQIHIPGSGSNRARQGASATLSIVLMSEMSNSERLELAERGLVYVDTLDMQTEGVSNTVGALRQANVTLVSTANKVRGRSARPHALAIADIAESRLTYIDEVYDLLSGMNKDTRDIFQRIIADNGEVTETHVAELNADLDEAELQYDRLSVVYNELATLSSEFEEHFFEVRVHLNR